MKTSEINTERCLSCEGKGWVYDNPFGEPLSDNDASVPCEKCGGTGWISFGCNKLPKREITKHDWKTPFEGLYLAIHPVGSRVTCSPPVLDTDEDFLCLVRDYDRFLEVARSEGFEIGGSLPADEQQLAPHAWSSFASLTRAKDNVNIIITLSREFMNKFLAATSVAKRLNLLDKDDRIALFQAVLYGNPCSGVQK